jgi:hypothetical protein
MMSPPLIRKYSHPQLALHSNAVPCRPMTSMMVALLDINANGLLLVPGTDDMTATCSVQYF